MSRPGPDGRCSMSKAKKRALIIKQLRQWMPGTRGKRKELQAAAARILADAEKDLAGPTAEESSALTFAKLKRGPTREQRLQELANSIRSRQVQITFAETFAKESGCTVSWPRIIAPLWDVMVNMSAAGIGELVPPMPQ